jgi:hypothetical protein
MDKNSLAVELNVFYLVPENKTSAKPAPPEQQWLT